LLKDFWSTKTSRLAQELDMPEDRKTKKISHL